MYDVSSLLGLAIFFFKVDVLKCGCHLLYTVYSVSKSWLSRKDEQQR
jgi:hypothetical protein